MSIGFIGLGNLGAAMARRLISEGETLLVWNRTRSRAQQLGADIADTPADIADRCQTIILNLFDSDAVHAVFADTGGLLSGDCSGRLIIDTTTNHPDAVLAFYEMCRDRGADYLEAPVAGSVVPASTGTLTILASGARTAFDSARPLLEKLGRNIFHLPEPGDATRMKLINNMVLGSFMATLAEATALAEAAGLDKPRVLEILAAGAGDSGVLNAKRQRLLDSDFTPHFSVGAIYKDLHYLQDLAARLGRPVFTGSIARELFALAAAAGDRDNDLSAVYRVFTAKPAKYA